MGDTDMMEVQLRRTLLSSIRSCWFWGIYITWGSFISFLSGDCDCQIASYFQILRGLEGPLINFYSLLAYLTTDFVALSLSSLKIQDYSMSLIQSSSLENYILSSGKLDSIGFSMMEKFMESDIFFEQMGELGRADVFTSVQEISLISSLGKIYSYYLLLFFLLKIFSLSLFSAEGVFDLEATSAIGWRMLQLKRACCWSSGRVDLVLKMESKIWRRLSSLFIFYAFYVTEGCRLNFWKISFLFFLLSKLLCCWLLNFISLSSDREKTSLQSGCFLSYSITKERVGSSLDSSNSSDSRLMFSPLLLISRSFFPSAITNESLSSFNIDIIIKYTLRYSRSLTKNGQQPVQSKWPS